MKDKNWSVVITIKSIGPGKDGAPVVHGETTHTDNSDDPLAHNDKVMRYAGGVMGAAAGMVAQARADTAALVSVAAAPKARRKR